MIIFVCIVLAVIIVLLVVAVNKKKKTKAITPPKIDLGEPTTSNVYISEEFKEKKDRTKQEGNHTITTLYESQKDNFVWICPNCEVENPVSKKKCCVCHYVK